MCGALPGTRFMHCQMDFPVASWISVNAKRHFGGWVGMRIHLLRARCAARNEQRKRNA